MRHIAPSLHSGGANVFGVPTIAGARLPSEPSVITEGFVNREFSVAEDLHEPMQHFVEEVGLLFSELGGQRMMGRVLGHLLVCDPPHQSSAELARALQASTGSISTVTRMLVASAMIERVAMPGQRATYFRIRPGMWVDHMRQQMSSLRVMRQTAERGMALMADEAPEKAARLREFRDFYVFMERQLPKMFDDWVAHQAGLSPEAT